MKNDVRRERATAATVDVRFGAVLVTLAGLALIAAATLLAGESRVSALTNCTVNESEIPLNSEEAAFLALINAYRADNGKGPLTNSLVLNRAGVWHSADMIAKGYFAHNEPGGRTWSQRMTDCGYPTGGYRGENIAGGFATAQSVFNAWKNSPGHNANMLNGNFTKIGIGKVGTYWNTDFGSVSDGGGGGSSATSTPTRTPTKTPVPATPTATKTAVPATPTATKTAAPATPTKTAVPGIATNTPVPATSTATATSAAPSATATATNTAEPATATPTNVPVATATPGMTVTKGANLIAWTGGTVSPKSVVAGQPLVKTIYGWDPVNKKWELYAPDVPGYVNSLLSMKPGKAYWFIVR